jgi:hypothetical protein
MNRWEKRPLVSWHTLPDRTANVLPMRGLPPSTPEFTAYDRRNMRLYTWLLILAEDGAGLDEIAKCAFGFDLHSNPDWARRVTLSHLKRASWVHEHIWPCID